MKIIDCIQGSPEWKAARAGKVTASRVADVMATIKTGEAASRRDYRAQIVAEILTGEPQDDLFINKEMQWGIDNEPLARAAFEVHTGFMVNQVGLVLHPTIERAAASPDGLVVGDDGEYQGGLEIKCPKTATHLGYIQDDVVPAKYIPQMVWSMACTGLTEWTFVSFDPRLPEEHQLFIKILDRDEAKIREMEEAVRRFLSEVESTLRLLGERASLKSVHA